MRSASKTSFWSSAIRILLLSSTMDRCSPALSITRRFFRALEESRRVHFLGPSSERRRRTAPTERLDIFEKRRVGAQGRQFLEQQGELALLAENVRRKFLNRAELI